MVVRSFDVFDTVVTRRVGSPRAALVECGRRLPEVGSPTSSPAAFASARLEAEWRLKRLLGRQPDLAAVHGELGRALGYGPGTAERVHALELAVEHDVCAAVPGAAGRLDSARREGPVVFVSDTPLTERELEELLRHLDLWAPTDRCFTSASRGASKADGKLFPIVASVCGTSPDRLRHVGDDRRSDLAAGRLVGVPAAHDGRAELTRYERSLDAAAEHTNGLGPALAGAGRMARLRGAQEGIDRDLAVVTTGVLAPLLVSYDLWLLRQADDLGLERLLFVSRDGEAILQGIRPLAARLAPNLDLGYLYGSRAVWRRAALARDDLIDDVLATTPRHAAETADSLLGSLGLDVAEVHARTRHPALHPESLGAPLASDIGDELLTLVAEEPVRSLLRAANAGVHTRTTTYLQSAGLGGDVRTGVVDVGWSGRLIRTLDDLCRDAGPLGPPAHYFLVGSGPEAARYLGADLARRVRGYLFEHAGIEGAPDPMLGHVTLIEAFCAGLEGTLVDYREVDGRIEPVLAPDGGRALRTWGLVEVRRLLDLFTEELTATRTDLHTHVDMTRPLWDVLRAFWEHPTAGEVARWGDLPVDVHRADTAHEPLAAPVSTRQVVARVREGRWSLRSAPWLVGSAGRSPQPWRAALHARAWLYRNGARLRRVPRRLRLELALRRRTR